jgi:hypothetical protein
MLNAEIAAVAANNHLRRECVVVVAHIAARPPSSARIVTVVDASASVRNSGTDASSGRFIPIIVVVRRRSTPRVSHF